MTIQETLKQAENYFIGQLIEGNFEPLETTEYSLRVQLTKADYQFRFWIQSPNNFKVWVTSWTEDNLNPVFLNFTDRERETLYTLMKSVHQRMEQELLEKEVELAQEKLDKYKQKA